MNQYKHANVFSYNLLFLSTVFIIQQPALEASTHAFYYYLKFYYFLLWKYPAAREHVSHIYNLQRTQEPRFFMGRGRFYHAKESRNK